MWVAVLSGSWSWMKLCGSIWVCFRPPRPNRSSWIGHRRSTRERPRQVMETTRRFGKVQLLRVGWTCLFGGNEHVCFCGTFRQNFSCCSALIQWHSCWCFVRSSLQKIGNVLPILRTIPHLKNHVLKKVTWCYHSYLVCFLFVVSVVFCMFT